MKLKTKLPKRKITIMMGTTDEVRCHTTQKEGRIWEKIKEEDHWEQPTSSRKSKKEGEITQ
jgi:hypothetical protein